MTLRGEGNSRKRDVVAEKASDQATFPQVQRGPCICLPGSTLSLSDQMAQLQESPVAPGLPHRVLSLFSRLPRVPSPGKPLSRALLDHEPSVTGVGPPLVKGGCSPEQWTRNLWEGRAAGRAAPPGGSALHLPCCLCTGPPSLQGDTRVLALLHARHRRGPPSWSQRVLWAWPAAGLSGGFGAGHRESSMERWSGTERDEHGLSPLLPHTGTGIRVPRGPSTPSPPHTLSPALASAGSQTEPTYLTPAPSWDCLEGTFTHTEGGGD